MKEKIILVCLVLFAGFLRFFMLGVNPPSLDWDEASMGYNAYSILHTGKDEYGNFLPLSIRSFDDYKPPVYTYLTVPSIAIIGLAPLAIRFPAAFIGILCVILVYFLTRDIEEEIVGKKKDWHPVALLATLFLTISPWHLQFSRAAFEGNIGVFFMTLGLWLFFKGIKKEYYFLVSSVAFLGALYSYHSFRVLVPILFILLGILFWKEIHKKIPILIVAFSICLLGSLPILLGVFTHTTTNARLSMVTVFSDDTTNNTGLKSLEKAEKNKDTLGIIFANRRLVWAKAIVKGYLEHFSPDYLFLVGDSGQQHQAVGMGMLYLWDLPFLLLGMFSLIATKNKKAVLVLLLVALAPIPSSITTGAPHAVRDIGTLPFIQIIIAVGVWSAYLYIKSKKSNFYLVSSVLLATFLLIFNIVYYLHQYYIATQRDQAQYWQYGYAQMFGTVKGYEKTYQHILVTYYYDQPYIYYLLFNRIDPVWYQKYWQTSESLSAIRMYRKIGKYEFLPIDWSKDQLRKNTLIVAAPGEVPQNIKVLEKIYFPNGSVAFEIIGL